MKLNEYIEAQRRREQKLDELARDVSIVREEVTAQSEEINDLNDAVVELGMIVGGEEDG